MNSIIEAQETLMIAMEDNRLAVWLLGYPKPPEWLNQKLHERAMYWDKFYPQEYGFYLWDEKDCKMHWHWY